MKNRLPTGLLMTVIAILSILTFQVWGSLSVEAANSASEKQEVDKGIDGASAERVSTPEENTISFEALLQEVLENNPELSFYEAEVLAAKGLRKTAGLWGNPEVSSSIGRKRATGSSEEGESSSSSGPASEIAVMQTIPWPGRMRLRKAIANRDIELAEIGLEQFRSLLKARTKIAAYTLSALQERAEATQEVADHFQALREVLIQRDQAGLTPLLETRVIEAIEINMQRKASQASLEAKAALYDLNQLRGAKPNEAFKLAKMNLTFRPIETDKNEIIKLAGANDYQVRLKAIELERQGYAVKLAKNERFPDITAGPAIASERTGGDRERIIGAQISVPLPIWNWNQGNVTTAKAEQIQAETSFDVAQRDAERRAVEAISTYETKLKEMENWRPDSIQHFKEAAELADRHYRLGSVPVSTYIELQSQYLDTIAGLQETKKEALETATQIEIMTGADLSLVVTNAGDKL